MQCRNDIAHVRGDILQTPQVPGGGKLLKSVSFARVQEDYAASCASTTITFLDSSIECLLLVTPVITVAPVSIRPTVPLRRAALRDSRHRKYGKTQEYSRH